MKKKQVLAVSSALMIGTTTALTGLPTPVMGQENTEVVQKAIIEENKTEQVPVEQETENAEVQENIIDKEEETAENIRTLKEDLTEVKYKTGNTCSTRKGKRFPKIKSLKKARIQEVKAGSIAIDEAHFPDKVFRDYLLEHPDLDDNNELSEEECNKLTVIFIDGNVKDLKSLKGIEYFPNLIEIYCPKTNLSQLDITKNTKLKEVNLTGAPIRQLDVSKNVELEKLNISGTSIADIDVSNNTKLKIFDCQNTKISNLDVSQNLELESLICAYTAIENLNIQNNTKLQDLYIHNTKLQEINTSNNTLLKELVCYRTPITSLDISNNTKLKIFNCQNTNISILDVSQNLELESLNFSYTQITSLDISNNSNLKELCFYGNNIAEIDIRHNLALEEIWCQDSNIQMLDVSKHTNLKRLRAHNVKFLGLYFGNNPALDIEFSSPTRKPIHIEGNTFNLLEQTNKNIDLSKITITSNGTLNKNTGIVTVEDKTKDVIYEYDCGISQKGKEILEVVLELNSQTENTAPTISANDVTLNVGDTFDPLAGVTATDKEDGTITLTKDNIVANDVDTSKAGIYHVTFRIVDKNGAITEKTITVTVKEKATNKPVSPQQPQKQNKPNNTTKASKLNGQTETPKTGDMTNVGLFASIFAGSTGALAVLFGKKRKRNKKD